jgi:hypothetical protein
MREPEASRCASSEHVPRGGLAQTISPRKWHFVGPAIHLSGGQARRSDVTADAENRVSN